MKERYFRFMKKDKDYPEYKDCIDYLFFRIWRFHFKWFLDCGTWFIYIEWWTPDYIKGWRFSKEAGNMKLNHKRH